MNNVQLIKTGDGSHSLLNVAMDETYHSRHGALRESEHVFIRNGLHAWVEENPTVEAVRILEVGMGTGLNALLTVREALRQVSLTFQYITLEPYPLPSETLSALNYLKMLNDATLPAHFSALHQAPWEEDYPLLDNFALHKTQRTLQDFPMVSQAYDLIYFDAFAPNKQPELWTLEALRSIAMRMVPGAIFVTYSAKGQLKRDLKTLNLLVETLEGPPGKAEMVRARKIND